MSLDMFLEILRSLEGLATKLALVRFQWDVDSDMRGDVVSLNGCGSTLAPGACEVKVVGGLATDVSFAYMFLGLNISLRK